MDQSPAADTQPEPRAQRSKTTLVTVAAVAVTMTAGAVLAAEPAAAAPRSAGRTTVVAQDGFDHTTKRGWGRATHGGAYRLSRTARADVRRGTGRILNLRPGRAFTASLPRIKVRDVHSEVTFSLSKLPRRGGGIYAQVAVRQQANGSRYVAVAHVRRDRSVGVSLSRVVGRRQVALTGERVIGKLRSKATPLTVRMEVRGTSVAQLHAAAYLGTRATRAWTVTATDRTVQLRRPGSIAMGAYVSRSSSTVSIAVRAHRSWLLRGLKSVPSSTVKPVKGTPVKPAEPTYPAGPTPNPANPSSAGSAPLGTTSYPAPADALWVSPQGDDRASGTEASPLRTLARAKSVARSGATVVLQAGTYHDSVDVDSSKRLVIQSAPNSVVWLDGSRPVGDWTRSGGTWTAPWTAFADRTPSYTGTVSTQKGWGFVDPAHPYAAYPDQVWVDGAALTQVGSAGAVAPGTFFADTAGKRLVIGSDPENADVRASDLEVALSLRAAGSVVRGIGIHRYATPVKAMGTLRMLGKGSVVENVVSSDNATTGITLLATDLTVRNVTATGNGMLGIHGNNADSLELSDVRSQYNNLQRFNSSPVAGGIKISRSRGITVRDADVSNNRASGLWLDESCYDIDVVRSVIKDNARHGLFIEISSRAVVSDNTITGNGGDGLKINNTDHVRVWNNRLGDNGINVEIVQDTREYMDRSTPGHDKRQAFPDRTMTWKVGDVDIVNTILTRSSSYNLNIRDYTNARTAAQMDVHILGSHFVRADSDKLVVWGVHNGVDILRSVADLASVGAGSGNSETVGNAQSSPSPANALPMPSDVAALVGQPAGVRWLGTF